MSETAKIWLSPLLTLLAVIGVWEAVTASGLIAPHLVPRPMLVAQALYTVYVNGTIYPHLLATATEMFGGFFIGSAVALVSAALVAEFRTLERCVYPLVAALQSMPKVALAPLLIVWFGFGLASKVVLVALICFFPVFVNALTGMQAARPELIDLYRAFSAPRWRIFRDIKLPSAAGSIFAGLQVGLVLALLGAVVGEFVAAQEGLGSLIQASSLNFDVPVMFACIVPLAAMGAVASSLVRWAQRRIVFWEGSRSSSAATLKQAA